jgi:hypothetical protein
VTVLLLLNLVLFLLPLDRQNAVGDVDFDVFSPSPGNSAVSS